MANNRCVYQQVTNVSVNKKKLQDIAIYESFDETDFRVFFILLTELNGWIRSDRTPDPCNYKKLDIESIAQSLGIKKKKVKASIDKFIDSDLVERGSTDTVEKGYRFTF